MASISLLYVESSSVEDVVDGFDGGIWSSARCLSRCFASRQSFFATIHWPSTLRVSRVIVNETAPRKRCGPGTYPLTPLTCHHFTPPTSCRQNSSPPRTWMRCVAAWSHDDIGTHILTTFTHGGDGVRAFENAAMVGQLNYPIDLLFQNTP